ncbi:unnamed protein product, partial [Vitis vinifera]
MSTYPSGEVQIHVRGIPFVLNRELLALRSSRVAALLKENPCQDLSYVLRDIPADPETFELVVRFCRGFELNLSTDNIVPLCCLAHYLGMTESHSVDNLLKKALTLFGERVLPSWNESVKALRASEKVAKQAMHLGLVDACLESIIGKALADPHLLGQPIRPWTSGSLSTLSLRLYTPIIDAMVKHKVPSQYVAASLCEYVKKWGFSGNTGGGETSIYKRNAQREVIEAVERLLPRERGLVPCSLLSEMLRFSVSLEASSDCKNGLEIRIGTQLDQATVEDLLIPSQGYAKETQYDTECVRRILKNFYRNNTSLDIPGIIKVSELMEEFLVEVASDIDLRISTFVSLAEMAAVTSRGTRRSSDGMYRAIDIYLDKHKHLTEAEREEACQMLDYQRMSPEALEHAARNERLPLRVVVQVLFVGQLQLRETITRKAEAEEEEEEDEEEEEEEGGGVELGCSEGGGVRREMEKMGSKVMELERECHVMRKEIEKGKSIGGKQMKGGVSMWKTMKRKFGCISSKHNSSCQVNKKRAHPI